MRQSLFYPAICGYALGILVCSFYNFSFGAEFCAAFFCGVFLIFLLGNSMIYSDTALKSYSLLFIILVSLLCVSVGMLRYSFFDLYEGDPLLAAVVGKKITAQGVIVAEPDERANNVRLTVAVDALVETDPATGAYVKILHAPTKVIMSADPDFKPAYGDRISMAGTLVRPENFIGDNGREFNYVSYLAKDRILYELNYPKVSFLSAGHGTQIESDILFLKNKFLAGLESVVPAPESSLGAGLVIAGKRALPPDIQNEFERSGTIQVVVLSGYNVTIVAEMFASIFSFLPLVLSVACSVGGIIAFTIAAGATATVIRAALMALIVIAATLMRRRYNVLRALIFSAFVMLIANPFLLAFDPSFQLSFIATFGLIGVSPMIEKYFLFLPESLSIRSTAVATVATQIFVSPFLLYLTGTFSVVAIPANLLIFLLIPVTMLVCFLAGILGIGSIFFMKLWARLAAFPATALLRYELFIVHVFASFPFAAVSVPAFPAWVMLLAYACYAVAIGCFYMTKPAGARSDNDVTAALLQGFRQTVTAKPISSSAPVSSSTSEMKF